MSSQQGKQSAGGVSPSSVAANLGLRWNAPGKGDALLTWDKLLDLAAVAYWVRRPRPERAARKIA